MNVTNTDVQQLSSNSSAVLSWVILKDVVLQTGWSPAMAHLALVPALPRAAPSGWSPYYQVRGGSSDGSISKGLGRGSSGPGKGRADWGGWEGARCLQGNTACAPYRCFHYVRTQMPVVKRGGGPEEGATCPMFKPLTFSLMVYSKEIKNYTDSSGKAVKVGRLKF